MTMKPILVASSVLLAVASGASAQQPVPKAPPAQVLPQAPPAQVHTFTVPDFHFDLPSFPHVTWTPDVEKLFDLQFHVDDAVTLAMAQKEPFVVTGSGKGSAPFFIQEHSQIDNVYSQARNFIDRDQYDRALGPLERVIGAKGERADAAMYWKAYSLMKLARRDEASSTLGQLQKQHPQSRWLGDARALEVEMKQAAGQPVATDAANDDLKLMALQSIMRTDPEAAFPVVEKMLAGGASVRVKERALYVLSQSRNDRALTIIGNVARGGSNPDLQRTAIRQLGISSTPDAVTMLTNVYRADNAIDTKKAVISALASSRNPTATSALVTLARTEKNPELKTLIVRHLSNSSHPEVKGLMMDLLK